jgi:ribosomal protein S18 acetylase RimI-like enzyme
MNDEYLIRSAVVTDNIFIVEAIIAAEKSGSEKLGLSTLFNIPEPEIKKLLMCCLDEESSGCEFSLNSFLIAEYSGKPVAAVAGWIENFNSNISSRTIKTNLIHFVFPKENILIAHSNSDIAKDILISREKNTLQIEYVYTHNEYRGKELAGRLINKHIAISRAKYPGLAKVQVQVFNNNQSAKKVYEKYGFKPISLYTSGSKETLKYLPYHEKLLMEKVLK